MATGVANVFFGGDAPLAFPAALPGNLAFFAALWCVLGAILWRGAGDVESDAAWRTVALVLLGVVVGGGVRLARLTLAGDYSSVEWLVGGVEMAVPLTVLCWRRMALRSEGARQTVADGQTSAETSSAHDAQVLVLGGGPAGLAAAISLAAEGCDVIVIEPDLARRSPRYGESLDWETPLLLERLGLSPREFVDAGRATWKEGAVASWAPSGERFSLGFHAIFRWPMALVGRLHPTLHLDRAALDEALTLRASRLGVRFVEAKATAVHLENDRLTRVELDDGRRLSANYVIDAAGRRALAPRAAGSPIDEIGPAKVAIRFRAAHRYDGRGTRIRLDDCDGGPVFPLMLHWTAWRKGSRGDRWWLALELALCIAVGTGAFTWTGAAFLQYHVIAMLVGQCLTAFFAVWTVHHDCDRSHYIARTIRGRFKSLLTFNMFYHVEHHLFPKVHTSRLPQLAERLDRHAPELQERRVF